MKRTTSAWLGAVLVLAACDSAGKPTKPGGGAMTGAVGSGQPGVPVTSDEKPGPPIDVPPGTALQPEGPYAIASGGSVMWKRHAALEADLMRALELKSDELCKELGQRDCIRDIHVIALGGNDPFRSGINVPAARTLSTTSVVVDRVLLSACSARARADKAIKPAKVFTDLDLSGPAPKPEAPAVGATITTLFRRLLARDPYANEVALLKTLLDASEPDAPRTAEDFATLACFTIGSSLEFLFQ